MSEFNSAKDIKYFEAEEKERYIQKMKFSIISSNRVWFLKNNLYNFSMERFN